MKNLSGFNFFRKSLRRHIAQQIRQSRQLVSY